MRWLSRSAVCIAAVACVSVCYAENFTITPTLALSSDQYHVLSLYKQFAQGYLTGAGSQLLISYQSSVPLNAYIVVMNADNTFNPADLFHFSLPAGEAENAMIDISVLSNWTPMNHTYFLQFLSNSEQTDTHFSQMTFRPSSVWDTIKAAATDGMQIEPYWVSTPHVLRGYRILSVPLPVIVGFLMILAVAIVMVRQKSIQQSALPVAMIMCMGTMIYGLRVAADLDVLSVNHLAVWLRSHTYGEAQDTYAVADAVNAQSQKNPGGLSVCFDSTDYYAKLIRYLVYPIPVTMTGSVKTDTTQVVVTHKIDWSYDQGILHCGAINQHATLIKKFDDGTQLFSLKKS